jgi:Erythromycin esterase
MVEEFSPAPCWHMPGVTTSSCSRGGVGLGSPRRAQARAARSPGSWQDLFHLRDDRRFLLLPADLDGVRPQRAIGAIYRPQTERISHYFDARLADQFAAIIHIDETSAVEPLERTSEWEAGELPETYPWAV